MFLPFHFKGSQITDPFDGSFEDLLPPLPVVVLVLAGEDIDLEAEPEQGKALEMAAAVDAATDSRKKALVKEKAADEADKKLRKVEAAASSEKDPEDLKELKAEADTAARQAQQAARKAAKAAAKAEDAAREAEASGTQLPDTDKKSP